ncbi:MAG TPA: AAA family ATPase [Ktedonobacteraceae bacterium]|nr:AAA family ATPase [Ktedonobacteraceae bacterium]
MSKLALYLFGPPRMERDGVAINADTRKAIALMAYLAVTRQRHSRDALSALLWPEYDQPHARATLRRTLSALNKALAGDWLLIERETIALDLYGDVWIDVNEFKTCLEQYYTHSHQQAETCPICMEFLNRAGSLYTDDFMAGFSLQDSSSFDDWQFYQADSLRRDLANALERLVQCYSAQGEFIKAIPHARRLLMLDRLHEPAHRYLMQLYTWSGQRAAAVHQYQECVKVLDQELGVTPLETTISLYEAIKENRLPPPSELLKPDPHPENREKASGSTEQVEELDTAAANTYPLVGRVTEWTSLVRIYTEKAIKGHIVGLEGEAGIGKTRLAEEFVAYARSRGASTITVRCYEGEVDLAYGPIVAGLRAAINQQQDEQWHQQIAPHWLSEATRLLPELTTLRPDLPPTPPLDGPGAQSRFFEGLRQVWLALCTSPRRTLPAVIFFDDIHWADETSLEFLSYLARRLQEQPIFLLLTWRSAQRSTVQRFHRLLTETRQSGEVWLFPLSRLDQSTVEQLIQQITLSDPDLPQGLTRRLYQETEGVPLFLTEYLTAMNSGLLKPEEHNWSLPGGIRDLLASRLLVVGETSRQLLGTAATIGRSFDFDTLREVSGRSEEETITGLEELISHGLVEEMRGTESHSLKVAVYRRYNVGNERSPIYDFCHEKLRSLVYDEITLARRRLLHRRTAEALVARLRGQRETGALAGQIAHHYQAAGNPETAAHYFHLAGEYARSLYAHTEALAHFRTALTLGHPEIAYLQEAIGDLHTFLGEYEAALKSYRAAEAHYAETPAGAHLKHKQGKIYDRRGSWEQAEQQFATALRLLDASGPDAPTDLQARIYADWSLTAHHQGRNDQELELAQQALSLAERIGDTRSLAQAHNMLGILANGRGEMEKAHFHLERSLALAENLQDAGIRAAALNNLALACKASGEVDRAISLTEAALALCSSQGDRHREAALHSNLADLFHEVGRTGDAMNQLKIAARIYAEIDVEAGTMQPEIWKLVEW